VHDCHAVAPDHDLCIERRVSDLANAEEVRASLRAAQCEGAGGVGELAPDVRVQGDDAEAERLAGFGTGDGAAEGWLLSSGELRTRQAEYPSNPTAQAASG